MEFRETLLNLAITAALVLVVVLGGILIKESRGPVKPAVPVKVAGLPGQTLPDEGGVPKDVADRFLVFPNPLLVESRANEADTLRIRSGKEEHIFVLYFVDALEATMNHPQRVAEQGRYFNNATNKMITDTGAEAAAYVADLLKKNHFNVFTRWERVPNTVRYYAIVYVEQPGGPVRLADLLMRKGYARVQGVTTELPGGRPDVPGYLAELQSLARKARDTKSGIWARFPR